MVDCNCCFESFSSDKKNLVQCQFCEFDVCQTCQKTYLLSTANQPHCMSCKKEWNDKHLYESFTRTFVDKDVKKHRETLLVENEKALLPETQPYVKTYQLGQMCVDFYDKIVATNWELYDEYNQQWPIKNMFDKANTIIAELKRHPIDHWLCEFVLSGFTNLPAIVPDDQMACDDKINRWVQYARKDPNGWKKYDYFPTEKVCPELFITLREKKGDWDELHKLYMKKYHEKRRLVDQLWGRRLGYIDRWKNMFENNPEKFIQNMGSNPDNQPTNKHAWKWACPNDECKGFLDEENTCGTCSKHFCSDCQCLEEDGHVCDENIKQNVKALKKDSKPCPKCSEVIHKIDGCDQMWCPQCKTAFSWTKGTIQTKIHNPHYYEYLRNTRGNVPREPGDNPCGEDIYEQINFQLSWGLMDNVKRDPIFFNVWRVIRKVASETEVHRYRVPEIRHDLRRLWRVRYLLGEIDETTWKRNLHRQEKAAKKKNEIHQILKTFYELAYEIAIDKSEPESPEFMHKKADKFDDLATYFNGVLAEFSRMYKCVVPVIPGKIVGQENYSYRNLETKKYTPIKNN